MMKATRFKPSKSINEMWNLIAQPGILETFLALNFRPSDSHCVHIDAGASEKTRAAMEGVFKCYQEKYPVSNIFSIRFPMKVFWGHPTVLEVCMLVILNYTRQHLPICTFPFRLTLCA